MGWCPHHPIGVNVLPTIVPQYLRDLFRVGMDGMHRLACGWRLIITVADRQSLADENQLHVGGTLGYNHYAIVRSRCYRMLLSGLEMGSAEFSRSKGVSRYAREDRSFQEDKQSRI
jgi:hypothetical protein